MPSNGNICVTGEGLAETRGESIEAANAVPGSQRADINFDDSSYSIRKSRQVDGVAAHATSSTGGLGEGTPKVCPSFFESFICSLRSVLNFTVCLLTEMFPEN